ncbi:MAG: phospholipid carrier-dependent glycosyltransferase [Pseudoxanthomonas sp.]
MSALPRTVPSRLRPLPAMLLVALLAMLNFVVGIGQPGKPVWDESYYLTSTQRYEQGIAQFASHPPLGLMLIATGDALLRPNRGTAVRTLGWDKRVKGEELPAAFSLQGVRLASGVFAVVGAVAFFCLMLTLTQRTIAALAFSNLYVFENAFIVHFRAAHLDAFQLAFSVCALLCIAISVQRRQRGWPWLEFAFGLFCGLATMVKLNAGVLMLLGAMLIAWRAGKGWRIAPQRRLLMTAARDSAAMAAGCALAIVAVFAAHVAAGPNPPDTRSPAGMQDVRFVSGDYRAYLDGGRPLSPAVVLAAARGYADFMAADFAGMARSDPNASPPLQWPLHRKTINYRWDSDGVRTGYVQLSGNLFSWSLALLSPVAALCLLLLQWRRPLPGGWTPRRVLMAMLLLQYLAFMAVHAWLGTQRVMYLYHYFIGLLLAFCLIPLVLEESARRWRVLRANNTPLLASMTVLLLGSFVFYSPLTFHRPLTHAECERRNLFQQVVECRP